MLIELEGQIAKYSNCGEVLAEAVAVVRQLGPEYIKARMSALSPREFDGFCLLAKGKTAHEVSDDLCLSYKMVSNFSTHIKSKLNASTAADLAHIGMVLGLI